MTLAMETDTAPAEDTETGEAIETVVPLILTALE